MVRAASAWTSFAPEDVRTFKILQKYVRLNLLVPVDFPNMWNAAMESKTRRLTGLASTNADVLRKTHLAACARSSEVPDLAASRRSFS
jgi:hypothetical protein